MFVVTIGTSQNVNPSSASGLLFIFCDLERDHYANTAHHPDSENNRPGEIDPAKAQEKRAYSELVS